MKARHKLSNERLAELIGCEKQTVANAENENGDMLAVTLLRIAYAFGEESIAPVRQLYLCAPVDEPDELEFCRRSIRELTKLEKRLEAKQ